MAKSLRDEVEELIPDLVDVLLGQAANYHQEYKQAQDDISEADADALDERLRSVAKFMLAKVFDRHPPADGVLVSIKPDDAARLYNAANELMMQMLLDGLWDKRETAHSKLEWVLMRIDGGEYKPMQIPQADAILSTEAEV